MLLHRPPDGRPVIYCHGAIGSPLRDTVSLAPLTHRLHARHIAVNRPGFGGSDLVGGRTVTAFAVRASPHAGHAVARSAGPGRAGRVPGAARRLGDALLPVLHRHPALLHRVIAAHAAPTERARLAAPGRRRGLSPRDRIWCRRDVKEHLTYSRGWGFRPRDVETEVQVWHGGLDPLVPIEHALQLAVSLPACRAFVDPDEGHHFFRRRLEES